MHELLNRMWVFLYRDGQTKRYETLGLYSEMTKTEAQEKCEGIIKDINQRNASTPDPEITFADFVVGVALPFSRTNWKKSTAATTENRIGHHLIRDLGDLRLKDLDLMALQNYLNKKAKSRSKSVVAHLRWDLGKIFKIAASTKHVDGDPTKALVIPRVAAAGTRRVMNREEVEKHIAALSGRERLIDHLAVFTGMRPGEILALQRWHVSDDCRTIRIDQRVYRGDLDTPKTESSNRKAAVPPKTAMLLKEWMGCVGPDPKAWLFPCEDPAKPLWRDNLWYRHMKPKLDKVGLGWANFQVMRRTHASLGHELGIDPKVSADQRGHGIGVALDVYTQASIGQRAEAAERLENSVLVN